MRLERSRKQHRGRLRESGLAKILFKDSADTLFPMFCGWWLANSDKDLERLGSGIQT